MDSSRPDPLTDLQRDLDPVREILANKLCALVGRSEIKDLVDLRALLGSGGDLDSGLVDAERKDGSADPATLAWVLADLRIGPEARVPGGVEPASLEAFRIDLVARLRRMAFDRARGR